MKKELRELTEEEKKKNSKIDKIINYTIYIVGGILIILFLLVVFKII